MLGSGTRLLLRHEESGRVVLSWRSLLIAICGVAIAVTSSQATWVRDGNGSTLRGLDLAHSLLNGPMSSQVSPWATVAAAAIYASALLGFVMAGSVIFSGITWVLARTALAGSLLAAGVVVSVSGWFGPGRWGTAPVVAVVAAGIVLVVSVADLRARGQGRRGDV